MKAMTRKSLAILALAHVGASVPFANADGIEQSPVLLISVEAPLCKTCPAYTAEAYASGLVVYRGSRNVEVIGERRHGVPESYVAFIRNNRSGHGRDMRGAGVPCVRKSTCAHHVVKVVDHAGKESILQIDIDAKCGNRDIGGPVGLDADAAILGLADYLCGEHAKRIGIRTLIPGQQIELKYCETHYFDGRE